MNARLKLLRKVFKRMPVGEVFLQRSLARILGGPVRFSPEKYQIMKKINLGCSDKPLPGWTNLDVRRIPSAQIIANAISLPLKTNSVDLLRASHILEHFYPDEIKGIVTEWVRVIKSGGYLMISVPDFDGVIERYRLKKKAWLDFSSPNFNSWVLDQIYGLGFQSSKQDYYKHRIVFNVESLTSALKSYGGLKVIGSWNFAKEPPITYGIMDDSCDCYSINILSQKV